MVALSERPGSGRRPAGEAERGGHRRRTSRRDLLLRRRSLDRRSGRRALKDDHDADQSAVLRLTRLLRIEALYLLSQTSLGLVVCATAGMQTRTPGFHAVLSDELIILTPITAELESTLRDDRLVTYQAESIDEPTRTGWRATFTGQARIVGGPQPRRHRVAVSHFEAGLGTRLLRLRPRDIEGYRLQR